MLCPKCFTSWNKEQEEDFVLHLEKHGLDPWKCKQLSKENKVVALYQRHAPEDACKCSMWGCRFECEMRIYRTQLT